MNAELVPAYTQAPAIRQWTNEQLEMATRSFAKDCTTAELEVFVEACHRKNLDPWLGQIVAIKRKGEMIIQETIEGYRTIAERSGLYGGWQGPWWKSADGDWGEVWLGEGPPAAAKILVIRKDWTDPAPGVASWASNAQFYRDKQGVSQLVPIWKERPDEMLAKCAEVRALKRAFSKEFAVAGINTRELSDAQVVTIEARRAGLDNDARHALVSKVTGGRTDSTRDLTEEELIAVRAEVAAIGDYDEEPGYVDEDGVIHVPEPEAEQTGPGDNPESPERRPTPPPEVAEPSAPDDDKQPYIVQLGEWNRRATPEQRAWIHDWLRAHKIESGKPLKEYSFDDLGQIVLEVERRDRLGWPSGEPF
jgi:phage recombination protein Bet